MYWSKQVAPSACGKTINVLKELNALRNRLRARASSFVLSPLQACVTNIDGKKGHRLRYRKFRLIITKVTAFKYLHFAAAAK